MEDIAKEAPVEEAKQKQSPVSLKTPSVSNALVVYGVLVIVVTILLIAMSFWFTRGSNRRITMVKNLARTQDPSALLQQIRSLLKTRRPDAESPKDALDVLVKDEGRRLRLLRVLDQLNEATYSAQSLEKEAFQTLRKEAIDLCLSLKLYKP